MNFFPVERHAQIYLQLSLNLRAIISGYNESVGGVNDATQGYHHTITMTFLAGVRGFLTRCDPAAASCTAWLPRERVSLDRMIANLKLLGLPD